MSSPPPSGTESSRTWLAFFACVVIWGSTFLVIRIGNSTVPPIWAATLRLAIAALVLHGVLLVLRQPLPRGAALRAAIGYGVFQFGGNFTLLYWAETVVPSGIAAVIFATIPLSTALATRLVGLERLTGTKILGAMVGLAGVVLIMWDRLGSLGELMPMFALLLATWLAVVGTILLKRGGRQSAIGANAVGCTVGAPITFALSTLAGESHVLPAGVTAWWPVLYLAIAGSVGAFVIFSWLVTRWEITRTSYIGVMLPIVALTLGALVLGERFSTTAMIGSFVVVLGVAIGLQLLGRPRPAPAAGAKG